MDYVELHYTAQVKGLIEAGGTTLNEAAISLTCFPLDASFVDTQNLVLEEVFNKIICAYALLKSAKEMLEAKNYHSKNLEEGH